MFVLIYVPFPIASRRSGSSGRARVPLPFDWSPVALWWAEPGPADEPHNPPHDTLAVPAAPYVLLSNQHLPLIPVNSKFPLYNATQTPWHIRPNPKWAAVDL